MRILLALAAAAFAGSALAQETPAACRADAEGMIDWEACAQAAPRGSNLELAAEANLATFAYYDYDLDAATEHFERTLEIMGPHATGEPFLHALRGATFDAAGKAAEARGDLDKALAAVNAGAVPAEAQSEFYAIVLAPLKYSGHPGFETARDRFLALAAPDAESLVTRAAVLGDIEEFDKGVADARRAMALSPNDPDALGVACWLLVEAGLNQEAVDTCRKADLAAPGQPDVLADFSVALAETGRCEDARAVAARLDAIAPPEDGAEPFSCGN